MHPEDFVESYIDAWNHRDARCVADHFTADGIYCDVPSQMRHPREELITYLTDLFSHDNYRYTLVGEIATGENSIAFQYRVCPKGAAAEEEGWHGAEFVTLQGNQAVQIDDFYEQPTIKSNGIVTSSKYAKSGLGPELLERYKQQLSSLMTTERVYLDANLTLPKLSRLVQCPVNHLSQVINAGFGMSFFDYLNSYRIEEAKTILRQKDDPCPPILTVAFEVGFNSNSAFYAAFKKSCGQTPAQYRRARRRSGDEDLLIPVETLGSGS